MIKINKNVILVPDSIQLPRKSLFLHSVPRPAVTTNIKRVLLIRAGKYIDNQNYNSRYKQKDVKELLKSIYKNKCAYCEQIVEQGHVEHYRPKCVYYWMAYSWDNLLYVCATCNSYKKTSFDVLQKVELSMSINLFKRIHTLSEAYDLIEEPKMVNPEVSDPKEKVYFLKNGEIKSNNVRFRYTIATCRIDRVFLNDKRRKILNTFRDDVTRALVFGETKDEQISLLSNIVEKFTKESKDEELEFLAFRRFVAKNWMLKIILKLLRY